MGHRAPLFCDAALALRIEAAEAGLIVAASRAAQARSGTAGFVLPIAGGAATFARPDSRSPRSSDSVSAGSRARRARCRRRRLRRHGAPVQVELAHLADPEIGAMLSDRVPARGLRERPRDRPRHRPRSRRPAPGSRSGSAATTSRGLAGGRGRGFGPPRHRGPALARRVPRQAVEDAERDFAAAGITRYAALHDGVLAGGADFRIADGVAQLAGAATCPRTAAAASRPALLATRLADARAAGCTIAVLVAQPGSPSHRNAQRSGFDLLYTRATLVKTTTRR